MTADAKHAAKPAAQPTVDPVQEIRFAVVIYGGVSLAIYINGVVQELLRMVRATAPASPSSNTPLVTSLDSSEKVYRKLGQIVGDLAQTPAQMSASLKDEDPVQTRFIIDVLSGTSAGGINAMFLAKALANDQSIDGLKDLWVTEGDIGKLINDKVSLKGTKDRLELQKPPQALLNGQRMYLRLLEALDGMDKSPAAMPSPLVDRLDLFSTTTDIVGLTLPVALADGVVDERRHRNVFHFRYPSLESPHGTDFRVDDNPFLAFAARCTSAFPFAFEPMTLSDVFPIVRTATLHRHEEYCDPITSHWQRYYADYLGSDNPDRFALSFKERAFGDGGYLDNKPFSYAINTMFTRHAELPVSRKLVYIEPSPQQIRGVTRTTRPDAVDNSVAALVSLPRYETIREDLERVIERNIRIDRLKNLVRAIAADLQAPDSGAVPDQWLREGGSSRRYGGGYTMYETLKVSTVTDDLVDIVARALAIDQASGYASAMRLLAAVWRSSRYPHDAERRQFLLDFDLGYRLRRLRYVRRQLNDWARDPQERPAVRNELKEIKKKLKVPHDQLQRLVEKPRTAGDVAAGSEAFPPAELKLVMEPPLRLADWPGLDQSEHPLEPSQRGRQERAEFVIHGLNRSRAIDAIAEALKSEFVPAFKAASADAQASFADDPGLTPDAAEARRRVRDTYRRFEAYDAALFPITYGTDLGEGETIDIYRISPDDATARQADVPVDGNKVKGQALGAFAAFLDKSWRDNDILWGRLDGAERIISILLPGRDDETARLRQSLIDEAHQAIVEERFPLREGMAVGWKQRLAEFVEKEVRKDPEPQAAATAAARATAVTGAILDAIAEKRRLTRRPFAYLALVGRILWEFVEVAAPRSLSEIVFVYWVQVLLASAILVALAGVLAGPDVRAFGLYAVAVLLAVYFLRRAIRRFLEGRSLATAGTLSVGTCAGVLATAVLLANAGRLTSHAPTWLARLMGYVNLPQVAHQAAFVMANGFGYLEISALLFACVTGAIARNMASKIEPPVDARQVRRPMLALELASTWGEARTVIGGDGHNARHQVRRALVADYSFIAAYTFLFVAIGLSAGVAGKAAGWALVALAAIAGISDVLENLAIADIIQQPLPRPFVPHADLGRPPRRFALLKWGAVALATLLALALIATPFVATLAKSWH